MQGQLRHGLHETMTEGEKVLLLRTAAETEGAWIEYGGGLSTLDTLPVRSGRPIVTVEGSKEFIDGWMLQRDELKAALDNGAITVMFHDARGTGPLSQYNPELQQAGSEYANAPFPTSSEKPELDQAFVDGRFRVACALACWLRGVKRVLIHDFMNRPHYYGLLEFFDIEKGVDTMALLKPKDRTAELSQRVEQMIESFYADPR